MEQDNKSVALRVIEPVEVDKIMIRRFPTLAPIRNGITSRQPTCINGLQVPAGEPPRRAISSRPNRRSPCLTGIGIERFKRLALVQSYLPFGSSGGTKP